MSKILRFLTCLFCIVFIGDAVFAAGYECPTYRARRIVNIPPVTRGIIWHILIRGRHMIVSNILRRRELGTRVVHVRIMILTIIGPRVHITVRVERPSRC